MSECAYVCSRAQVDARGLLAALEALGGAEEERHVRDRADFPPSDPASCRQTDAVSRPFAIVCCRCRVLVLSKTRDFPSPSL